MQITIARDGQQMGPYSLEMVNAYLAQGMLVPTDMAWYEGAPGWVPLPQVPGASIAGGPGIAAAGGKSKKGLVIGLVAGGVGLVVVALVAMLFIWKPWGGVDNLPGEEITTSQLFLNTNPVSKPAGWQEFSSAEHGFSVVMPPRPRKEMGGELLLGTENIPGSLMQLVFQVHAVDTNGETVGSEVQLKAFQHGFKKPLKAQGTRMVSDRMIRIKGQPVWEAIIEVPGMGGIKVDARTYSFFKKGRVYTLGIMAAKGVPFPKEKAQFFVDSFKVIE